MSDIGKCFSGVVFSAAEYTETEGRYLACVERILQACAVDALTISGLEDYDHTTAWENGQILRGEALLRFLRDGLREICWGRLTGSGVSLDFGYDYYLHIGCPLNRDELEAIVHAHGLFPEPWKAEFWD